MKCYTKIQKNNEAVDVIYREFISNGFNATPSGHYGDSQLYVKARDGADNWAIRVVSITRSPNRPAQFMVPDGMYDALAVVLFGENCQVEETVVINSDKLTSPAYTFTSRRNGLLDRIAIRIDSFKEIMDELITARLTLYGVPKSKLESAREIMKAPLTSREAPVQKTIFDLLEEMKAAA